MTKEGLMKFGVQIWSAVILLNDYDSMTFLTHQAATSFYAQYIRALSNFNDRFGILPLFNWGNLIEIIKQLKPNNGVYFTK